MLMEVIKALIRLIIAFLMRQGVGNSIDKCIRVGIPNYDIISCDVIFHIQVFAANFPFGICSILLHKGRKCYVNGIELNKWCICTELCRDFWSFQSKYHIFTTIPTLIPPNFPMGIFTHWKIGGIKLWKIVKLVKSCRDTFKNNLLI